MLAPTLIRSQILARLYGLVRCGDTDRRAAEHQLDYIRGLRLRLLGDRVLQGLAWKLAEYIALTQLQADAFVCIDPELARTVGGMVRLASIAELTGSYQPD